MKIAKEQLRTIFDELKPGDCFKIIDDEYVYLKINTLYVLLNEYNAVNLNNNQITEIAPITSVYKLDATLNY